MRFDRMHHLLVLTVTAGDLGTDEGMAALHLVGQRLAKIVQQRSPLGQSWWQPQLSCHDPRQMGGLDEVRENVLAIAGPIPQASEQGDQLRVHLRDPGLHKRVLASADAASLNLTPGPLVLLLNAVWMNTPIRDQGLQGDFPDLTPHRIETAQQDRLRRVIDNDIHPGDRLERADVASLAADDAAFHLVVGQVQHRNDRFRGRFRGDALNRQRHDFPGPVLALLTSLRLNIADEHGGISTSIGLDKFDKLGTRLGRGEPGRALQRLATLLLQINKLGPTPGEINFSSGKITISGLELACLLINHGRANLQALFALDEPSILRVELGSQLPHLRLGLRPERLGRLAA